MVIKKSIYIYDEVLFSWLDWRRAQDSNYAANSYKANMYVYIYHSNLDIYFDIQAYVYTRLMSSIIFIVNPLIIPLLGTVLS